MKCKQMKLVLIDEIGCDGCHFAIKGMDLLDCVNSPACPKESKHFDLLMCTKSKWKLIPFNPEEI